MNFLDGSLFTENQPPLVITAAPYGPEWIPSDFPEDIPVTMEEQIQKAVDCYAAGASVLHLHVRELDGDLRLLDQRLEGGQVGLVQVALARADVEGVAIGLGPAVDDVVLRRRHRLLWRYRTRPRRRLEPRPHPQRGQQRPPPAARRSRRNQTFRR